MSADNELNDWGWFIEIEEYEDSTNNQKPNKFVSSRYVAVLKTITETHSFDSFVDLESNTLETSTNSTSTNTDKYFEKHPKKINLTSYCVVAVAVAYCIAFL